MLEVSLHFGLVLAQLLDLLLEGLLNLALVFRMLDVLILDLLQEVKVVLVETLVRKVFVVQL